MNNPGAMTVSLEGKKALVTGGSRGIGRAIALQLAACGADVCIVFRKSEKEAAEVVDAISDMGRKSLSLQCDASVASEAEKAVKNCLHELGEIHILVNNVAISDNVPFLGLDSETWNRAVTVNINSLFNFSHPVLHHMKDRRSGHILNVGSICGVRPIAAVPVHYSATKGAMNAFTFTLAKEMARYNILVNSIAPGLIETDFAAGLPEIRKKDFERFCPLRRMGTPAEIARLAVFLVSDLNSYMTGETVIVGGGL